MCDQSNKHVILFKGQQPRYEYNMAICPVEAEDEVLIYNKDIIYECTYLGYTLLISTC